MNGLSTGSVENGLPGVSWCLFNGSQDTDTSRPGRSCNSVPGLADQKDTDRLMNSMQQRTDSGQPRPAICPVCGLTADNAVLRRDTTRAVSYVCTNSHLFATTWVEVA